MYKFLAPRVDAGGAKLRTGSNLHTGLHVVLSLVTIRLLHVLDLAS